MALTLSFVRETNQVLFAGNSCVKEAILNRPHKLNILNHEMISQLKKRLMMYEKDPSLKLIILKANGKAFCAGGDVISAVTSSIAGHWTFPAASYKKQLTLDLLIATYKEPVVSLINGVVMGGGAGLSMNTTFRVVTEKTVFAMPEASIGLSPDVGAAYFLSRLPGSFGEYLGLTGRRLNGAEMVKCGLATHLFLPRLDTINKCFSKGTVEEIVLSLEKEIEVDGAEKWIADALNDMRAACPTSPKIWLRSVKEGRVQSIEQFLNREYNIVSYFFQRTVNNDFYEGSRAKLFDKDNKPMWDPPKLELVTEEMINQYFGKVEDENWECLQLPHRSNIPSKL